MMVFTKVIIMKINQSLNSFLHCCHLKKSHFVILKKLKCFHSAPGVGKQSSQILFCYRRTRERRQEESRLIQTTVDLPLCYTTTVLSHELRYSRDVGQVKGCRRRENVLKVFGSRFFKTVQG